MAALMCMTEGHGPAVFVGTFFPSGDSVRVCDECMPLFCAGVFERMTGVDLGPAMAIWHAASEDEAAEVEGHPEEVAAPPDMEPKGNTGPEAPEPAPHDTDNGADPTSGAVSEPAPNGAKAPASVSSRVASSEPESPPIDREATEAAA
jgi:hypothetical protein